MISIKIWLKNFLSKSTFVRTVSRMDSVSHGCTVWGLRCESAASLVSSTLVTPPIWPEPEGLEPQWYKQRTWFFVCAPRATRLKKWDYLFWRVRMIKYVCTFFRWICWLCLLFSPARSAKNEREAWKYIKKQTLDRVAPWLCSVLISDGRLGHCQACLAFPDGKGNNESVNSMIELKGLAGPSLKRVNGPLKMDGSSRIGIAAPVSWQ